MNSSGGFLSIKDLFVEYTSDKKTIFAVNGVSLELEKGKSLGLVGETGAGKTTIAKSILRILPEYSAKIKSGQCIVGGEDMLRKTEKEMLEIRGKKIAMIFQDPMTALNPIMCIGDQIAEVLELHDSKAEAKTKAMKMLEMVGIAPERYIGFPYQFSGGMKQRVVIAMALACNPELLLADEPTTALDVTIQAQILQMIQDLQQNFGTSMLLITHALGVVAETCDDVAVIYAGEIMETGSKEDLFDHPTHPYTIGLLGSLPKLHEETDRLTPIKGRMPNPSRLPEGCKFHPRCELAVERCKSGQMEMVEVSPGHYCRCCQVNGLES